MKLKAAFILLCAFMTADAQTVTQMDKDTKLLFNQFYKPLLASVTFCTPAKNPTPDSMAKCAEQAKTWGHRFPTPKEADAEAWQCARLHAGLLPYNGWKIIDDAATDPWTAWRCLEPTCHMGTNEETIAKSTVRSYVVDATGAVYDHRTRYFIRPDWAKALGKINTRNSVTLWNKKSASINAALKAQAPK